MVSGEHIESIAHPAVQALIQIKWKLYGNVALVVDLVTYFTVLLSISWEAILYPMREVQGASGGCGNAIRFPCFDSPIAISLTGKPVSSCLQDHPKQYQAVSMLNLAVNIWMILQETLLGAAVCIEESSIR